MLLASLDRDVLDAILVVRILRLVKLVGNIERFKVIFGTFSKVIPTLMTYLRVMFVRAPCLVVAERDGSIPLDDLLYIRDDR